MALIGELLFDDVRWTIRERVHSLPTDGTEVKPLELGENAGALGGI